MQNIILFLFSIFFTIGSYLVLAHLLKVPTLKASKAILNMGKAEKKKARDSDALIMELAIRSVNTLSKRNVFPMDEYKKRKLAAALKSAEISMSAEVYVAQAFIKTLMILLGAIPCLLIVPIISPAFVIMAVAIYFNETGKADKIVRGKREEIENELPRFAATLTQALKASRDVMRILETYQKNAGNAMKQELMITTADMGSGNYEAALTRFEGRVSSAMLSDVVRGLVGVVRGDDGVSYFQMLTHDMKQLELQRLKKMALERPPKIRRYSFLLLVCMLMIYLGVMGYQIIGTMSGIF